jgi:hypothetical protein
MGLVVSEKKTIFLCTNSQFICGLMTAQAVDPLRLFRHPLFTTIYS